MNHHKALGYVAPLLVLAAYCMRGMAALRIVGIASNLAFMAYGALAEIGPVLLLHAVLLPINVCRLVQTLRVGRREECANGPSYNPPPWRPSRAATTKIRFAC